MSLNDIEHLALKSGAQIEASVLNVLGHEEAEASQAVEQICEHCGSRMQRRGVHQRHVMTKGGPTTVERVYYVCPGCGASLFPPG